MPTGTPNPMVSVIIPCRNEVGHVADCLRSVLAFEPPPGSFEVIVADGMSDDGTRDILARFAAKDERLRVVDNPQRNTSGGLNTAIRAARGEIIARVDAHTEYAPDYLRRCVEVLRETGADNAGGPALTKATGYLQCAIAAAYHSRFAVGNAVFHLPGYEGLADTVPYGCWPRAVFDRIGLFDEELIRNQDDEFNYRLCRAGGKIWQSPRIRSWYSPRDSLPALFRQYFQYGYWKVRVAQKHGSPASLRHLVPGTLAAVLTLLALSAPFAVPARVGLIALIGVYFTALLGASTVTASGSAWNLLPVLPAVFACYHLGYGFGFLFGVWDFIVRRRSSGRYVALTRK